MSAMVVYVHGLWLNGWEAAWLRRRLSRQLECETCLFSYPSVRADLKANAGALARFLAQVQGDTLHLVGHSMGGLVILEFFDRLRSADRLLKDSRPLPPGRIVLLGTPVQGSRAAVRLSQCPAGKRILGATAPDVLLKPRSGAWSGARELGIIAGDFPFGLGKLMGPAEAPNDGTILVEETRLSGAQGHLTLRVSHSGMMLSAAVARHTATFLRNGRFDP